MIYFDNSATTPPCREATDAVLSAMTQLWGNPSSAHSMGVSAQKMLETSKRDVMTALGAKDGKLIFTSGGTEANNLAIIGSVHSKERAKKGASRGKIIISDGEHASVENAARQLESEGFTVFRIPTRGGALDLDALSREATPDVILASVMKVNNETGAVYDTKTASRIIKEAAPGAVFHTDCVQAFLKMKLSPADLGADMVSVSAHKIFSAKGAGALYVSGEILKTKKLLGVTYGGHQEEGFRAGTEATPAIAAFGAAAKKGSSELKERMARTAALGAYAERAISSLDGVRLNLPEIRLPNILNITVPGIKSETLLNYLSGAGICVSKSSACSTRAKALSAALIAFGLSDADVDSSIRLSFSHLNTEEEIDIFCSTLARGVATLAKIRR